MNLSNTFILLIATLLILSGCKKEEITYPITLEFDRIESKDNGIRAYEDQNGIVTEINADTYRQDPDLDLTNLEYPDKIVISSAIKATVYFGINPFATTLVISGKKYEFRYFENENEYFTLEAKGDETELVFKGGVNKVIEAGTGTEVYLQSEVCDYSTNAQILGCHNHQLELGPVSPVAVDDGQIHLLHYFDLIYN